jgi:hypothetical protein
MRSSVLTGLLIAVLLAALPVAVWLYLTSLAEVALRRQATDLNSVISSVQSYYASNVVGRVLANPGATKVVHDYETIAGAIPIPATIVARAWQAHQRTAAEHQVSLRFRLSLQEPHAASIGRFREDVPAKPAR